MNMPESIDPAYFTLWIKTGHPPLDACCFVKGLLDDSRSQPGIVMHQLDFTKRPHQHPAASEELTASRDVRAESCSTQHKHG
jgi:hypothetical protein